MKKIDISGNKYGRLTVIKENGRSGKNIIWLCKCDCGNEINAIAYNLKNGHTQSCGCIVSDNNKANHSTHGQSNTRLYKIWRHIKSRCLNKKVHHYKYYGGRCITMCPEWIDSFETFMTWALSNGYNNKLSIDRIDVDGNYNPSNCRWTNAKIQANNRTNNHIIEYKGQRKTLSNWADILGINSVTLSKRINDYGWSIERAFETHIRRAIPHETILCGCGCGTIINRYSKYGRERRYVLGHNLNCQNKR